jgi:hypothetical protein
LSYWYFLGNFPYSWAIFLCYHLILCFLFFTEFPPLLPLISKCVIKRIFFFQFIPKSDISTESMLILNRFIYLTSTSIIITHFILFLCLSFWKLSNTRTIFLTNNLIFFFLLWAEFGPFLSLKRKCVIKWILLPQFISESRVTSDCRLVPDPFFSPTFTSFINLYLWYFLVRNFSYTWAIFLCNYFIPCFLLFIQFAPLLSLESKGVILWVFFLQLIPKSYIGTKCWLIPKDFDSNARVFTV